MWARSLNTSNLDNLINIHRFAYFKLIRNLIQEGEVSLYEKHPKADIAVKVQLFADGDLNVFIANSGRQLDDKAYKFLEQAYKKIHQKIKSLEALRRDIERVFSLMATGLISAFYYYLGEASIEEIIGLLGSGFLFPEVRKWGKQFYQWIFPID